MVCCNCNKDAVAEHLPSTEEYGDRSLWCFECFVENFCTVSATVLIENSQYKRITGSKFEVETYTGAKS